MTREETKKIVMIVSASYPNWKPQDLSFTVDTWHLMLQENEYNEMALALKAYVLTNMSGFAPSIGQLIESLHKITHRNEEDTLNEMTAWSMVYAAVCRSNYYAEEEFNKLPDVIQKAIGCPKNLREWGQLPTSEVNTVIQSNFMRSFKVVQSREKELQKMPSEMRERIIQLSLQIGMEHQAEQREVI